MPEIGDLVQWTFPFARFGQTVYIGYVIEVGDECIIIQWFNGSLFTYFIEDRFQVRGDYVILNRA